MSCYHFHMDQIKRSEGRSVVAAAAYRAGEALNDNYYGVRQDYTKKEGVVLAEIHLPAGAPERFLDREVLWNEVEQVEKNRKAQLAHSFNIALMNEFSLEENIEIARRFVDEQLVSRGMIADLAVHLPKKAEGEPENPHIHIMVPIRPLKEDGSWGIKQKKVPVVDEKGNPIFGKNGKPKMRAVPTTDWSSKETLLELRQAWEALNNELYEAKGMTERIDCRSYEERGIPLIPTLHEGPNVRAMEARGIQTELGTLNRMIRAVNEFMRRMMVAKEWIRERGRELLEQRRQLKEPTIVSWLQVYYDERNRVAEGFQYGTNKAKISNLKDFSQVINLLLEKDICTEEDLEKAILSLNAEVEAVRKYLALRSKEIAKYQKLIRDAKAYPKLKELKEQYDKKWFGKEKFWNEHEKELKRYHVVAKELEPFFQKHNILPIQKWEEMIEKLSDETRGKELELKNLEKELAMLKKVQKCIDTAMGIEQEVDGDDDSSKMGSIHGRLEDKKKQITGQQKESYSASKENGKTKSKRKEVETR